MLFFVPTARCNSLDIYFERKGQGQKLLFIGGTGADLRSPLTVFHGPLPRHFDLVAFDQRGQGRSSAPETDYTMADYARDALGLLDHLGWEQAAVLGVSFGGMVAQELVLMAPERISKLVLASTSTGGPGGASFPLHTLCEMSQTERVKALILANDTRLTPTWAAEHPEKLNQKVREFIFGNFIGAAKTPWDGGIARQLQARRHHDTYARLADPKNQQVLAKIPTLLCGGIYDGLCPTARFDALAALLPHAEKALFAGSHLFFAEDPSAMAKVITFLSEPQSRAP